MDVQHLEKLPRTEAVGSREDAPVAQHPRGLRQQAILELRRRQVMEHGEAHDCRETAVGERHLGRVALLDGDALRQHPAQPLAVVLLELEHAQVPIRWASTRVVAPNPGPISKTSSPSSTPLRPRGSSSRSTVRATSRMNR